MTTFLLLMLLFNLPLTGSDVMSLGFGSQEWARTESTACWLFWSKGGIIAQNEQSCVVFGMPQCAIEVKAASHILPLRDIASMLISILPK